MKRSLIASLAAVSCIIIFILIHFVKEKTQGRLQRSPHCRVYARKWSELFKSWEGKISEDNKSLFRAHARSYCERQEAYK